LTAADRPHGKDAQGARVNHRETVLVLEIHVDTALAVGACKLGFGIQRYGANDFVAHRINGGRVAAATVESEYTPRRRVIDDGIGVLAGGLDVLEMRERLEVEHDDRAGGARARLAASEIGCERDAV